MQFKKKFFRPQNGSRLLLFFKAMTSKIWFYFSHRHFDCFLHSLLHFVVFIFIYWLNIINWIRFIYQIYYKPNTRKEFVLLWRAKSNNNCAKKNKNKNSWKDVKCHLIWKVLPDGFLFQCFNHTFSWRTFHLLILYVAFYFLILIIYFLWIIIFIFL